jgi:hypothetical protein
LKSAYLAKQTLIDSVNVISIPCSLYARVPAFGGVYAHGFK